MTSLYRLAGAACVVLAAACESAPTGPAMLAIGSASMQDVSSVERSTEEFVLDLTGFEFVFFCEDGSNSEPVIVSGRLRETVTFFTTPEGTLRSRFRSTGEDLSAVGSISGDEYRFIAQFQDGMQNGEGLTLRFRERFRMQNVRTHEAFDVVATGRMVLDENWDIVSEREQVRVGCPA